MKVVLTIAGSDSSGGAGIQADLKTMTCLGVYGMSAITALTAQNTMGVDEVVETSLDMLEAQIDSCLNDIKADAVKIGMLPSAEQVLVVARKLREYKMKNIVVDPVMVATSGSKLLSDDAISTLTQELIPLADIITPNIPEAEVLSGMTITTEDDMVEAAKSIYESLGCAVLCKGGHQVNDANDLLYSADGPVWFKGKRIDNPNTHGTGCTLSSAIASNLAKGKTLEESVKAAKDYISGALAAMLDLGKGSGPLAHNYVFLQK